MAHLIDKDALVAEIERLRKKNNESENVYDFGTEGALKSVLSFINTLEVKEVDLESEMDKYFETMEVLEHEYIFEDTFQKIARHFFELGLKAKQG